MDQMTLTLNSPITEEQGDMITDVDFDYTDNITFHTKHGIKVEFVKRKTGKWLPYLSEGLTVKCSECGSRFDRPWHHCPNCGASMTEGESS